MQRIGIKIREEIEGLLKERGEEELPDLSTQELLRLRPSLAPLFEDMAQAVQDIEQHGCLFKDLELGLVEFSCASRRRGDLSVLAVWRKRNRLLSSSDRGVFRPSSNRGSASQTTLSAVAVPSQKSHQIRDTAITFAEIESDMKHYRAILFDLFSTVALFQARPFTDLCLERANVPIDYGSAPDHD